MNYKMKEINNKSSFSFTDILKTIGIQSLKTIKWISIALLSFGTECYMFHVCV